MVQYSTCIGVFGGRNTHEYGFPFLCKQLLCVRQSNLLPLHTAVLHLGRGAMEKRNERTRARVRHGNVFYGGVLQPNKGNTIMSQLQIMHLLD